MTTAEQIAYASAESTTINYVRGMIKKGLDANFIADAFELPLQKVEEIIQRIKESKKP